ncbi:MAG: hypothetical protein LUH05_09345 [Candidatus Gastranaerophilales bacterium]|nr:hypothetical protein [Candidatus Gastranaerophilales bacterium]
MNNKLLFILLISSILLYSAGFYQSSYADNMYVQSLSSGNDITSNSGILYTNEELPYNNNSSNQETTEQNTSEININGLYYYPYVPYYYPTYIITPYYRRITGTGGYNYNGFGYNYKGFAYNYGSGIKKPAAAANIQKPVQKPIQQNSMQKPIKNKSDGST